MNRYDIGDDERAYRVDEIAGSLIARSASLLEPFERQKVSIRSVTVASIAPGRDKLHALLFRVDGGEIGPAPAVAATPVWPEAGSGRSDTFAALRREAREACGERSGEDLLVAPAELLAAVAGSADPHCAYRAVAAVTPKPRAAVPVDLDLTLRRGLFDCGLVGIGAFAMGARRIEVFLASEAIHAPAFLGGGERGSIAMSSLGSNGRFANQLFQYAFLKLYALRHGATVLLQDWEGSRVFGLKEQNGNGERLRELEFPAFENKELALWSADDPPLDVDFWGYFQEIPPCWQPHRHLLRTLFTLPARHSKRLDAWCHDLTDGGRRELVAVHVRRTDYVAQKLPWFRTIPEEWYLDWLRKLWPTLTDPVLFVATDDPGAVLPHFAEFSPRSTADLPRSSLPDHIGDFELLRRANHLAICNSSFSRMPAILAEDTQRCFIPSLTEKRFVPYDPWSDRQFWARFDKPNRYFDVTDLLRYLLDHSTISGIQRVQCEFIRHLDEQDAGTNFTIFNRAGLAVVAKSALLEIVERLHANAAATLELQGKIRETLATATHADVRAGDLFLATGAFWAVKRIGRLVNRLRNEGLTVGIFIHDILPISRPEYFEADCGNSQVRPVVEVLASADFVITSSTYNKEAVAAHRKRQKLDPIPIHVVPLGHGLPNAPAEPADRVDLPASPVKPPFVLCVGTIEVRKNPSYLFNLWKLMVEAGRDDIPTLVMVGRKGWMVDGFFGQLKASGNLGGRIVVMHDLSDEMLDVLYRDCLLTVFPSFDEGWGLPVGESLVHGKICLASRAGGIPEAGGDLVDYIDPYNVRDGYDRLVGYLDSPDSRLSRERKIAEEFRPRSWQSYAAGIVGAVESSIGRPRETSRPAAVSLSANEFLSIGKSIEGSSQEAVRGYLSAGSACVAGWGDLQAVGIRARGPLSVLQFRTARASRDKLSLVLRLSASGPAPCRIDVRVESGDEKQLAIEPGADTMVTLACESDEDGLVTVRFETDDGHDSGSAAPSTWKLKGLLYIQPSELAAGKPARALERQTVKPAGETSPLEAADGGGAEPSIKVVASTAARQSVRSLAEFLKVPNSTWQPVGEGMTYRREPILVCSDDRHLFHTRYRNSGSARLGAVREGVSFNRLTDQYVSMERFVEGAVLDESGVAKDAGYLRAASADVPFLTRDREATWIRKKALSEAAQLDGCFAIFFNGNLHNYYHWLAEGLLALDILMRTIGDSLDLRIALPKTMDVAAVFDHRASLTALGLDRWPVVEVPSGMIRIGEAVWLGSGDLIEDVPAIEVRRFQSRVGSLYAGRRSPKGKRLLVKRLSWARPISNFEEVEAFLHPLGFETVWLDGASIADQVLMFQNAEFVVGAHGAGLTNLLFCEPGTRVIEFMPTVEMRPFFWLISEKLGLRHGMQFCSGVGGRDFNAPIRVDIEKLAALYDLMD